MKKYLGIFALSLVVMFIFTLNSNASDIPKGCVEKKGLVFCGAKNCLTTAAGNVACSGRAKECRATSGGNVVCGGLWNSN